MAMNGDEVVPKHTKKTSEEETTFVRLDKEGEKPKTEDKKEVSGPKKKAEDPPDESQSRESYGPDDWSSSDGWGYEHERPDERRQQPDWGDGGPRYHPREGGYGRPYYGRPYYGWRYGGRPYGHESGYNRWRGFGR